MSLYLIVQSAARMNINPFILAITKWGAILFGIAFVVKILADIYKSFRGDKK